MRIKPAVWFPVAVVLSVVNLGFVGYAAALAEPWHAGAHAVLGLAFGWWALRLRRIPAPAGGEEFQARLDTLEGEAGRLRQELVETQERLDFAERMLAQAQEKQRVGPQR